ncbi:hypothetical protein ACFPES_28200 [Paenibacillus sp. GCM10023248]|uniref:hypothetical protein n=1 Tax=unclassified Paenibacillus TaxID=185978 RepID=UPI002378173B|nr:hypothetical protein [Paenibacillus sp. MAHUQ-63]MDD9270936.1 hypothetical protein [Paenibacillus sp. MAHUQ-63]
MKKSDRRSSLKPKRIVAAGIVSLTVVLSASAGVSYADIDVAGVMASWFNKKTEQVIQGLDASMKSETDAQKELLKKELQLRLEASTRSLESFTDEQKRLHLQALGQYAQSLLASTDIKTEQDRAQIMNKLQTILDSAKDAMDTLADSYVPPAMVFAPAAPVIIAPPSVPAQPAPGIPSPAAPAPANPQPAAPAPATPAGSAPAAPATPAAPAPAGPAPGLPAAPEANPAPPAAHQPTVSDDVYGR